MTTVTISDSTYSYTITMKSQVAVPAHLLILTELRRNYDDVKIKADGISPKGYFSQMLPLDRNSITYLDIGVIVFLAGGALYSLLKF